MAALTFMPPYAGLIVLIVMSTLGQLEFYRMLDLAGIPSFRFWGTVGGAVILTTTFFTGPQHRESYQTILLAALLLIIFIRQFPQKHNQQPLATLGCTLLGLLYVPFLFNFLTRLAIEWNTSTTVPCMEQTGGVLILYLVAVVKCTDMGAYFTGRGFGRHKLFPRISPAKTWEGFAGGISASIAASFLFMNMTDYRLGSIHLTTLDALLLGIALGLAGTVGDLFESLLKRASGTKDSGAVMPGLGGILDVIDSLLFGGPILYAYITLVLI
jgi:phosphatidate cytidylyltransferase